MTLEAKELRIGNYLQTKTGDLTCVTDIEAVNAFDGMYIFWCYGYSESQIEPIELTEDWLLRLGFKKTPTKYYIGELNELHNRLLDLVLCTDKNVISYQDYLHPILYVHQLQNLYFALTNNELTLKR